ncbi:E3 ubiquitin-protein ligase [Lachnellula willkommii]|uniref:E3 ubiquitin-protein ligase n=1 Tax=Lachnellula willkommii TaxID=215461 RepID=A0A559MLH2_9HELO|nr:E3 ubiquitin-protein ligase [Lachnellula willkommii]
MEPENQGLDLERELTCSICTEVLYQPLTLLDCLHTFCGSCLKEWFSWQLTASRNSPNPLSAGTTPYTCPSCRAPVRNSRHDAKVTTLLEMFLAANPTKGKTAEEKEDIKKKYTPGEDVLPRVEAREKTLRERRAEDEDQRLLNEVRDLSLREVGVETPEARRERRRRDDSRVRSSRPHSSRDVSRDGRSGDERERRRRREADSERRRARDDVALRPGTESGEERRRRRSNEEGRRRHEETSRTAVRRIEHQSSLRSLISSSDVDSHEMEEEILRQIREEGLLDGIDLENIDVSQEDQISERIAEAFRRRQSEKARQERERRHDESERRREERISAPQSREASVDDGGRSSRRRRTHSRTTSAVSQGDEPSRPPTSLSAAHAAHLEVNSGDEGRRRRRTTSGHRSSTTPVPLAAAEARPAARSQTDLSDRPQSLHLPSARPLVTSNSRSSTDPTVQRPSELPVEQRSRESPKLPNSSPRMRAFARSDGFPAPAATTEPRTRAEPPAEIFVPSSTPSATTNSGSDRAMLPAPLSPRDHGLATLSDRANALSSGTRPTSSSSHSSRTRTQLFPEPSLTCARCAKPHIEYDLHYNCAICYGGNYNLCLSCYRSGQGCLHWFGFGYAAWAKWDRLTQSGELPADSERPHMLTANRYVPPRMAPGGADGRRTLTTDDPQKRLQSGAFCANCLAWANECYWRCDFCNEADWGFCNLCVNQGCSCPHDLLPLTFKPSESDAQPLTPTHEQQLPPSATILTGPGVMDIGRFKPLTFSTKCDVCHYPIQPSSTRYHCFSCTSKVPNTQPGDYDICTTCYPKLVSSRRISAENGNSGWRRCLKGHRMIIAGFEDNRGGQRRVVVQDLVGGRGLHEEPFKSMDLLDFQLWSWADGARVKLVTLDVMKTAPTNAPGISIASGFPPDGGIGMTCVALWSWYPAENANDELLFPKGAEIREVKDVNGDWYHGAYMGKRGLFPAPYIRILDKGTS